jgi:hypothetical protein
MKDLSDLSKEELINLVLSLDNNRKQKQESLERTKSILSKWDGIDLNKLTPADQIAYSHAVAEAQKFVDWNVEARKNHRPPIALAPKIVQRPPAINGVRFDSHFEVRNATDPFVIYPDNRIKLAYTIIKKYGVDGHITDTNIFIEYKPVIESQDQCRKFREVCLQNNCAILFVFIKRDISLWWNKQRKDGSVITQEERCDFQCKKTKDPVNFYYTFEDEADEFLKSEYWKSICLKHSSIKLQLAA